MSYKIFTDATSDLSQKILEEIGVISIPMPITIDGSETLYHSDERSFTIRDFYEKLRSGSMASTSQINVENYISFFEPVLKAGEDIIYICFSSGLSGSFQSANIAISELNKKYSKQIYVVDSLCAAAGAGLLVYEAAKKSKAGYSLE